MRYFFTTIITLILIITSVNSQNYRILRHFTGSGIDASHPQGALLKVDSSFFATSHWGGTYDKGCVYRINPDGTGFRLLYSFVSWSEGAYPLFPLVYLDSVFYGTAQCNTFFSIDKEGKKYKKIDISNPDSNSLNYGGGIFCYNSFFYGGIWYNKGNSIGNALVKFKKDGTEYSVLKRFDTDSLIGHSPEMGLVFIDSSVYSITSSSVNDANIYLFKIDTNGNNFRILNTFKNKTSPNGMSFGTPPLLLSGSSLYGIANGGGDYGKGVIFSIKPDGSNLKILHSFRGDTTDGYYTWTGLVPFRGYLYGLTQCGGKYDKGVIYRLKKDGSEYKIVHTFGEIPDDGIMPTGGMTVVGNTLYGTTWRGGRNDLGTIFKLTELDFWDSCDAESFNYPYFLSRDGLKLNGTSIITDSAVNLVQPKVNVAGSVFYKEPVTVAGGFKTSFSFRFRNGYNDFQDGSAPGADGIVFLIQGGGNGILGADGGELGYSGIPNSLAVEFDTYRNSDFNDPDGNHIAVFSNGKEPVTCTHNTPGELGCRPGALLFKADSSVYYGKVEYENEEKVLRIWLDKGGEYEKPVIEVNSIDLQSLIGLIDNKKAFIGFTSATGTSYQNTDLLSWSFCPRLSEGPNDVDEYSENIRTIIKSNPAWDYIEIDVGTGRDLSLPGNTIYVYNILGECVLANVVAETHDRASLRIDVSGLPPGVYLVRFSGTVYRFLKI